MSQEKSLGDDAPLPGDEPGEGEDGERGGDDGPRDDERDAGRGQPLVLGHDRDQARVRRAGQARHAHRVDAYKVLVANLPVFDVAVSVKHQD